MLAVIIMGGVMAGSDVFIRLVFSSELTTAFVTSGPCRHDYKFPLLSPSTIYLRLTLIANFVSLCMVFKLLECRPSEARRVY